MVNKELELLRLLLSFKLPRNCILLYTCMLWKEEINNPFSFFWWPKHLRCTGNRSLVLVTPRIFFVWYRGQVTTESMFLMAAAIAYRYSHLSKGNGAEHWMKACLKWVIGTVHIRYICVSPLVILEVEDITRKCTFGHITKRGVVITTHHLQRSISPI